MIPPLSLILILFHAALFEVQGLSQFVFMLSTLSQRMLPAVRYCYMLHNWYGHWPTSKDSLARRWVWANLQFIYFYLSANEMQGKVVKGRIYYGHLLEVTLMNKSTKENTSRGKTPTTICLPLANIAQNTMWYLNLIWLQSSRTLGWLQKILCSS